MPVLASEALLRENKKNPGTGCYARKESVGLGIKD